MSQLALSRWLKTIAVIFSAMAAAFCFGLTPYLAADFQRLYPQYPWAYGFFLARIWVLIVPFAAAMLCFWTVCRNIAADDSFCQKNAQMSSRISVCAVVDTVLCFCALLATGLLGVLRTGYLLASVLLIMGGAAAAVVSALLSHLLEKAAKLKEENDLTI